MDGKVLTIGKLNRQQFWMSPRQGCQDNGYVSTPEVVIQNGEIRQSSCSKLWNKSKASNDNFLFQPLQQALQVQGIIQTNIQVKHQMVCFLKQLLFKAFSISEYSYWNIKFQQIEFRIEVKHLSWMGTDKRRLLGKMWRKRWTMLILRWIWFLL